jgi:CRP/FNR family transcriptional regulator, cyclic AMP receptor protein
MSDDEIVRRLGEVDLFAGLPTRVLKHIASEGTTRSFDPGVPIVEEGANVKGWSSFSKEGVCFYVILEGSAEVEVHGTKRGVLEAGQYFGETSLIDGQPRTATVAAGPEGLRAFALTAFAFAPILEENPSIAISMLKVIVGRLRAAESRA